MSASGIDLARIQTIYHEGTRCWSDFFNGKCYSNLTGLPASQQWSIVGRVVAVVAAISLFLGATIALLSGLVAFAYMTKGEVKPMPNEDDIQQLMQKLAIFAAANPDAVKKYQAAQPSINLMAQVASVVVH